LNGIASYLWWMGQTIFGGGILFYFYFCILKIFLKLIIFLKLKF
jgi:hypothetical protein